MPLKRLLSSFSPLAPRCRGRNKDGKRCRKHTYSPDGLCPTHEGDLPYVSEQSAKHADSSAGTNEITGPLPHRPAQSAEHAGPSTGIKKITKPSTKTTSAPSAEHAGSSAGIKEITEPLTSALPATPAKQTTSNAVHSTPFNAVSGSQIDDKADARRFPMAADLAHRSYISPTLLKDFLEDIPDVPQETVLALYRRDEWLKFLMKCTGGGQSGSSKSSESNEEEFKALVQCIAEMLGLDKVVENSAEEIDNPRRGRVRISHQGNCSMTTCNPKAKWLKGNCGSTARQKELKPDLMSVLVDSAYRQQPCEAHTRSVQLAIPQTITPPPAKWRSAEMEDEHFPIVECKNPVWECLDVFWECKRNSEARKNATVYIDCSLKAAEALRYQWSRRFIYCFLHCGTEMQLLHFDRSGLMASKPISLITETADFLRCLLAVFWHPPSRLGYPSREDAPFHLRDPDDDDDPDDPDDPDDRRRQVVTVGGRQLFLADQEASPLRDHLVSRATVVFRARLREPKGGEKTGWDWCYKCSWPQKKRKHEGEYLEKLQGLANVVPMLAYSTIQVDNNNDTTIFGRQCDEGDAITIINTFFEKAKQEKTNFTQHTQSGISSQKGLTAELFDPRRPQGKLPQQCDNREHRQVVTAWVKSSFDEAVSSLASLPDSLPAILGIWEQAFTAVQEITKRGILHRDISFRNVRIDDQQQLKICDFDMAAQRHDEGSKAEEEAEAKADDRTGTIAFMATALLSSERRLHRPVHDCESVFWLCALELLCRVGIGDIAVQVTNITQPGKDINTVMSAKIALMTMLTSIDEIRPNHETSFRLNDPKNKPLLVCLTMLSRQFVMNGFFWDYRQGKNGGFEDACFDTCIAIVRAAYPGAGQAVEGIGQLSLDS